MRVFVLTTGRTGSKTFAESCRSISNFTSKHEEYARRPCTTREYPDQHIAVDNRLAYMLGVVADRYPDARYVHLVRDEPKVVNSFVHRMDGGKHCCGAGSIVEAHRRAVCQAPADKKTREQFSRDFVQTVNANILHFLRDKPHLVVTCGDLGSFRTFWDWIGAKGDWDRAVIRFTKVHNASKAD